MPCCGGHFYLDYGVARCPHCGLAVFADGEGTARNRVSIKRGAEPADFWAKEIQEILSEFRPERLGILLKETAARLGFEVEKKHDQAG